MFEKCDFCFVIKKKMSNFVPAYDATSSTVL